MFTVNTNHLRRLCEALDINPDDRPVTKIVLTCAARDIIRATVHYAVPVGEYEKVLEFAQSADPPVVVEVQPTTPAYVSQATPATDLFWGLLIGLVVTAGVVAGLRIF